jgi:uncharacterized protein
MLGRDNPPRLSQRVSPGFCQFVCWFVPSIFRNTVLTMMLMGRVIAGPLEDAWTAYERGDYATALHIWQSRAEQGVAVAQNNLGLMYFKGQGVPRDFGEAAKWYRLAAEQGNPGAQTNLGIMYYSGQGVTQDFGEAANWYRLAAEHGNSGAQTNLGFMYYTGQGVTLDQAEAARLYTLAAEQGEPRAQSNLAGMYATGEGVPQDYVQAYKWADLAASKFPASAAEDREEVIKNRDRLAGLMTPQQLTEARRLVRKWKSK